MVHASLFSGIGGPEVAAAMLGWENAFHCEINPFGRKILEYWFPDSVSYEDITKTDFKQWRGRIDVLTGGFPCFVAGTQVLTNRGFVPIEDVGIGDSVLTKDKTYHTVDAIMEHPADKIVTMRAQGMWEPLKATPNHKFWVRKRVRDHVAYHFTEPQWIPLSECRKGDRIGYPIYEGKDTLATPAFWKLVGTYLADGWINEGRVVICCGKHHVERLLGIIDAAGYHYTLSKERTVYKAIICNKSLAGFLKSFGKYAYGKFLPGFCFTLDNERKKAVLEGWFADGYETKRGHIQVTTVSQQLALGMSQLARDVYRCPVSVGKKTVNRTCVIEGRIVNEKPQYCVRISKSTRYGSYEYGHVWCNIKSIETGKEYNTVYNLSVNEEHSYNVYGIAVHNCQPFSYAGKRGGREDERYLWPQMLRAIDEIRPTWVIGENVAGITTMVEGEVLTEVGCSASLFGEADELHGYELRQSFTIERICSDLERLGYSVQPMLIPAAAVGAPHRRDRIFILAFDANANGGDDKRNPGGDEGQGREERLPQRHEVQQPGEPNQLRSTICGVAADTSNNGLGRAAKPGAETKVPGEVEEEGNSSQRDLSTPSTGLRWNAADSVGQGLEGQDESGDSEGGKRLRVRGDSPRYDWAADGSLLPENRWKDFPTVSPVHRGNDGIPFDVDDLTISFSKWRTESLKAYGNAIVPQLMYRIFKAIEEVSI